MDFFFFNQLKCFKIKYYYFSDKNICTFSAFEINYYWWHLVAARSPAVPESPLVRMLILVMKRHENIN